MGFFRFALAVLVVRSTETTTVSPEEEKGNCQTFVYHFGHEKTEGMLYECPEDKPVPKDLKLTQEDQVNAAKILAKAMKDGKKVGEATEQAWLEVCCPASMVGFAVFSLLL